ncbi:hypothetical protein [Nonomuraea sp. NPDC049709]|uniref:hypothetical protein n=1 Tax=Nonomuraea sp. NPDC049709 TaxID=3154736 RepID=UPI0034400561
MTERPSLARRYWQALIDTRAFEPDDRALRPSRDLSLWQRYRASLLGLPPSPARAPRGRRNWAMTFNRVLLPVAVAGMAVAVGTVVFRLPPSTDPIGAAPATTAASRHPRTTGWQLLYRGTVSLPLPADGKLLGFWVLTRQGPRSAEADDADFALSAYGSGAYVDMTRSRVGATPAQCLASPPETGGPADRAGPAEPLCLLTRAGDLAYLVLGEPAGGHVRADIRLWGSA